MSLRKTPYSSSPNLFATSASSASSASLACGPFAVTVMVIVLFVFLTVADLLLGQAMKLLTGGGA